MKICNLASGSKGNCTFLKCEKINMLIDAGLSCKEIEKRLKAIGENASSINAIIVTHEHRDHISGIQVFAKKFGVQVIASSFLWEVLDFKITSLFENQKFRFGEVPFNLNGVLITPFQLSHDSHCCHGFTFEEGGRKIGIATDLGFANKMAEKCLTGCDLVFIESNHDLQMLSDSQKYPQELKKRISGKRGHLSNEDCGKLVKILANSGTKRAVLSHISEEANTPQKALETVCSFLSDENIKISVAFQHSPSAIFSLSPHAKK